MNFRIGPFINFATSMKTMIHAVV